MTAFAIARWPPALPISAKNTGEKPFDITYEFKLELDRKMTISSFQSAGVSGAAPTPSAIPLPNPTAPAPPPMSGALQSKIKAEMAKLNAEDRRLAEELWRSFSDTLKDQAEANVRDFQKATQRWLDVAAQHGAPKA